MEVAVADVADQADRERRALVVLLGLHHAFGQARDRDADVGRPRGRAGAQRDRGVHRVMARLPQLRAILEVGRELKAAAAVLGGERLYRL